MSGQGSGKGAPGRVGGSDLSGLLRTLQQLRRRLLALVWSRRLNHDRPLQSGEPDIDIGPLVNRYLEQTLAGNGEGGGPASALATAEAPAAPVGDDGLATHRDGVHAPRPGVFQELSRHLGDRRRVRAIQPTLAEQLRDSTWKHLHEAASYAREGNAEAAKTHAELATHAMEEAYRFMSAEEFDRFRREVESALRRQHE